MTLVTDKELRKIIAYTKRRLGPDYIPLVATLGDSVTLAEWAGYSGA